MLLEYFLRTVCNVFLFIKMINTVHTCVLLRLKLRKSLMVFLTLKLHGGHFFFFLNFVFSLRTVFNKAMSVLTGIRIVILTELRKTVDSLFLVCHCGRKVCICHLYVNLGENVCVYCNVCLTNIFSSPVLPASKQN